MPSLAALPRLRRKRCCYPPQSRALRPHGRDPREMDSRDYERGLTYGERQAKQKLPPGISIAKADDFKEWQMDIQVLDDNPLYKGEIVSTLLFPHMCPREHQHDPAVDSSSPRPYK